VSSELSEEQKHPVREALSLLENSNLEECLDIVRELSARDLRRAFDRFDSDERLQVITGLGPDDASVIVQRLPESQAARILETLPAELAADIVEALPAPEGGDLLRALEEHSDEVLEKVDDTDGRISLQSSYPDDTAGALMEEHTLSVEDSRTVGTVLDLLTESQTSHREREVQYIYVTDKSGVLCGVLPLRNLVMAERRTRVKTVMIADPAHVVDSLDLEGLESKFEERKFLGLPVIDSEGKLLGVVTRSAVEKATAESRSDDYLKSAGIVGGEELRSMPIFERSKRRFGWLLPNIGLNLVSASVIAMFQDTLEAAIALAVFLPIVSDMSGCSGNQAVAVSVRELTLGILRPRDFVRVLIKEGLVGVINGLALGVVLGGVCYIWKQNLPLALVIGSALAINTLVSVMLGGVIPLALKKFKADPALASSPILTTCTDMFGFLLVLGIASRVL